MKKIVNRMTIRSESFASGAAKTLSFKNEYPLGVRFAYSNGGLFNWVVDQFAVTGAYETGFSVIVRINHNSTVGCALGIAWYRYK